MVKSRTILIVADDPTLLTTIKKQLAAVGFESISTRTANEAVDLLSRQRNGSGNSNV